MISSGTKLETFESTLLKLLFVNKICFSWILLRIRFLPHLKVCWKGFLTLIDCIPTSKLTGATHTPEECLGGKLSTHSLRTALRFCKSYRHRVFRNLICVILYLVSKSDWRQNFESELECILSCPNCSFFEYEYYSLNSGRIPRLPAIHTNLTDLK